MSCRAVRSFADLVGTDLPGGSYPDRHGDHRLPIGFTLSYDEFPRSWVTVGPKNTLPLEIWGMTTNITSPALYALGTVTTAISFIVIAIALISIAVIQLHRTRRRAARERAMQAES